MRNKKEPEQGISVMDEPALSKEIQRNPIEQAMHALRWNDSPTVKQFFIAWGIPHPVIAERLRIAGFPVDAKYISDILKSDAMDREQEYLLSILMMELKNDIIKTIYK